MATEIDDLQIRIEAEAAKANTAIDTLATKLDTLYNSLGRINGSSITNFANGVNQLALSVKTIASIDGRTFTALTNNMNKLAGIDSASIMSSAYSISSISKAFESLGSITDGTKNIGALASNISRLGGKNVQVAIANLPALAKALKEVMTVLSTSPKVTNNLIKMTNALASLASEGVKIKTATDVMTRGLERTISVSSRASKSTLSLSRAFGKFYANYFLLVRGFKGMITSVKSAMELTETVNYFDVTLRNIGESAKDNWKQYGYESADAYADSFAERLRESNEKLTGFTVSETGQISQSVFSGLGISPATATQYSAMFAQVANSIGMTEEASIALSEAFVRLGADWASLRNVDFEVAYEKLASGLSGQSRALRSFGIDITQATLQEVAFANGIEKSVSEMTQSEKSYLRLIAIIEQSEVAFGDLANTLASPANQMRMLSQGIQNLGTLIGNLFLPLLQRILPVLNGFVIALQRMVIAISETMGIDTSGFTSIGGMDEGFGDLSDSVDEATESAEKFNRATRGWDELNVLGKDTSKGYGVGNDIVENEQLLDAYDKAIEKYRKAWKQAYENIENDAEDWADRITPKLQGVVDTIIAIAPALEGVLAAFISYKTMTTIQKFAKYFDPAYQAIKSVVEGLDVTGEKLTVGNVMSGLRDRMTDTSKLIVGLGSVVTEFKGVHDGVEDLVTGSGNLLANLGKIAASAGIGAGGLYLAFGPAGAAFAAVAGLVSAVLGINDAVDYLVDARLGDSILTALTPSDGKPLEDVVDGLVDSFGDVSEEFDALKTNSSKLSTVRTNISDTVAEIESIKTAMNNGVLSVESGTARLETAFFNLATLTSEKFATIRNGLLSVLGDEGIVSEYLDKIGAGTEQTVDVIINYTYENETRAEEIITEMKSLEYGSEKYKQLELELISLSQGYDEVSKATDLFNQKVKRINWESVLGTDGKIDTGKIKKLFGQYESAYNEFSETLSEAELNVSVELQKMLDSKSLSKEDAKNIENTLSSLPTAFKNIREESEEEILDFATMLQNDLVEKSKEVIANAQKEWSEMGYWERTFSDFDSEGEFVKKALTDYLGEFSKVQKELEKNLEDLGIETSEMATDFNEGFISSLFDSEYIHREIGIGHYKYTLKSDYEKMIDELKKPTYQGAEDLGKALVAGFNLAIGENEETKKKVQGFTDSVKNLFKKNLDIHSPSGVTEEYGKFFVQGFNIGIENNMQSTLDIIDDFVRRIKNKLPSFSLFGNSFGFTLPKYAVGGFPEDGLFMANHSELVGKFSNGKTAVANNAQITQGIEEAAYRGMMRALSASNIGGRATFEVVGDPSGMFKVMQKQANQYTKSTGRNAFGY